MSISPTPGLTLGDLRTDLQFMIGFNLGQTNQDFAGNLTVGGTTLSQIDWAINKAYQRELEMAIQNGTIAWFKNHTTFIWPAGQLTIVPAIDVTQNQIIRFIDETGGLPGYELIVAATQDFGGVFWLDYQTLQWGTVGPGAAVTIGVEYIVSAEQLVNATDTPKWIPPQHHSVISWSAACLLREIADEMAPQSWYKGLQDRRESFWSYVSAGKPFYGHEHSADTPDGGG